MTRSIQFYAAVKCVCLMRSSDIQLLFYCLLFHKFFNASCEFKMLIGLAICFEFQLIIKSIDIRSIIYKQYLPFFHTTEYNNSVFPDSIDASYFCLLYGDNATIEFMYICTPHGFVYSLSILHF